MKQEMFYNNYKDGSETDDKCENTPSSPKLDVETMEVLNSTLERLSIAIENQQQILKSQQLIIEELRLNIKSK